MKPRSFANRTESCSSSAVRSRYYGKGGYNYKHNLTR